MIGRAKAVAGKAVIATADTASGIAAPKPITRATQGFCVELRTAEVRTEPIEMTQRATAAPTRSHQGEALPVGADESTPKYQTECAAPAAKIPSPAKKTALQGIDPLLREDATAQESPIKHRIGITPIRRNWSNVALTDDAPVKSETEAVTAKHAATIGAANETTQPGTFFLSLCLIICSPHLMYSSRILAKRDPRSRGEPTAIDAVNGVEHEPAQMIFRKPLAHRDR